MSEAVQSPRPDQDEGPLPPPDASRRTRHMADWEIYKRLLRYVVPMWPALVLTTIGFGLANGAEAYFARLFGDVVEALRAPRPQDWWWFPSLMFAAVLVRGFGDFVGEFFLSRVSFNLVHTIRCELFDGLLAMPSADFDRSARGHLVSRITFNVTQLRDTATDASKTLIQDGSKVLILLGAMFFANVKLTLIFVAIAPIVVLVVGYASRRFRRISRRIQNSMGDVTHVASEAVNGYRVVRTFGGEVYERDRFFRASESNRRQNVKMVATKASSTEIIQIFVAIALSLLISLLFRPEIAGGMTPGDVVYFVGLAGLLARPIKKLSEVNARLQRGLAAAEDIFSQLDQAVERDEGTFEIDRVSGLLEFRNVSFQYDEGKGPVLRNLSFVVRPGQTVALVGRSGSGKSTLASLIPRFYDPATGTILLDGRPVRDYRLASLRNQIALVTQQVVLFNDTLERNIAYGQLSGSTPEEVWNAVERAHADSFVREMPEGLATMVGDNGVMLSGGQRQRIAIARAFLKNAPILILDEATSALDFESEKHIQAALVEVMRGRTTIVIAHRLSTIERADMILVLDGGEIVERGTHAELLSRQGTYAHLYDSQFTDSGGGTRASPSSPAPVSPAPAPVVAAAVERQSRLTEDVPNVLVRAWYGNQLWPKLLWPAAKLYESGAKRRRFRYLTGKLAPWRASVPVIVVGNITAGGTGKTPFVIWLAQWLGDRGFRPAIVSRGYGGRSDRYPLEVGTDTTTAQAGDEPVLIRRRTGCPVVVDPDRVAAVAHLVDSGVCDVVLSDDGLQHYALARDIEIVVVDGRRGLGNGLCLPAGPLREPRSRLDEVDLIVSSGKASGVTKDEHVMSITPAAFVNLSTHERIGALEFPPGVVHALAGIGNPDRFVDTLTELGFEPHLVSLVDHHRFTIDDLLFDDDWPVIVTEKDAVKIEELDRSLVPKHCWYLEIDVDLPVAAEEALLRTLAAHAIAPRHPINGQTA